MTQPAQRDTALLVELADRIGLIAGTIEAWWPEVLGYRQTNVTNAATEVTNRSVQTAARTAYGFRNLDNQRRRVRFACTRCHRRVTDR